MKSKKGNNPFRGTVAPSYDVIYGIYETKNRLSYLCHELEELGDVDECHLDEDGIARGVIHIIHELVRR